MSALMEFFPLLCGSLLGLLLSQLRSAQMRQIVWLVLSGTSGFVAHQLSNEGRVWLLFDVLGVALTAQVVLALCARLSRRVAAR